MAVLSVHGRPLRSRRGTPSDDERWHQVEAKMRELDYRPDALIEVLHTAEEAFGYLGSTTLGYVAESLGVPLSKAYGVATFYSYFKLTPHGVHSCVVCTGTACYIDGASALLQAATDALGVCCGETTADGRVSLSEVRCLGPCSMAPVAVVDEEVHGKVSPAELVSLLEAL